MSDARQDTINRLEERGDFDVIVVGAGINGIGVFRDLSMQGLKVLLVDRNDFCSGCSAAPSRMIHGGLRYLENGEISLVRESLNERDRLLRNAPHFVHPLPTVIPIERLTSGMANAVVNLLGFKGRPRPRGALPIKLGLMLYDAIGGRKHGLARHRFRFNAATRQRWPDLRPEFRFSATYTDAWISHPERLGIELVADSLAGNPDAVALNYATLVHTRDGLVLTDGESGRRVSVRTGLIVNATGAWIDESAASLGVLHKDRLVSGTKGSHLIIDSPELVTALDGHMIYYEHHDGRVCIVFPYLGQVLAGSTDLRVDTAGRTACSVEERDYILSSLCSLFPGLPISSSQIVYSFAGIRPLPVSDADFTGRISRGHSLRRLQGEVAQIGMIGGKWTTYRAFAEETTNMVLQDLGRSRRASTRDLTIGGGCDYTEDLAAELVRSAGLTARRASHLVDLYGSGATAVADFCALGPDRALPGVELTEAEVVRFVRHEQARRLDDVLQRRSGLAIRGMLTPQLVDATARILALEIGWSDARAQEEITRFADDLATYHGVNLAPLKGAPS